MLVLGAAVATALSTYLHWLPCRGTMLSGSILRGYTYGPDFTEACLRRMDTGLPFPFPPELAERAPGAAELGLVAVVLAGLAWLVVVLTLRRSSRASALVAGLPALTNLALAGWGAYALGHADRDPYAGGALWLLAGVDVAAVAAVVAIWRGKPEIGPADVVRLLVVLWGVTAFGFLRSAAEYIAMGTFSDANWDVPPGTGYLTSAGLALSAALTIIVTLRIRPRAATLRPNRPDLAAAR